jgi:hypothetical protein
MSIWAVVSVACVSSFAQRTGPHWMNGGMGGVTRANYTVTSTNGKSGDQGSVGLPQSKYVYQVPLSVTTFAESPDFTLTNSGTVMIHTTGLYRIAICLDWKAQDETDIDLRYMGIGRIPAGSTLNGRMEGGLLNIQNARYDRLAVIDQPAADSPTHVRGSWTWAPGALAPGQAVSTVVTLPKTGLIAAGDLVEAAHTSLTDTAIGAEANAAVAISARVIAPDKVRITVENRWGNQAVTIPSGTLNLLASSATTSRGESADAWNVLQTPTVLLYAGEQIFGIWRSDTSGDYIQTTNQTYLQVERWD